MPMEVKDIFEANSKNVREMLSDRGLGLYVPPYQRPYGWDKEKVQKLVDDILHGYMQLLEDDETFTFLGTVITIHDINFTTVQPIVRQDVPSKVLTVIDGQQRLTSLLVLCLALHNQIRLAQAKLMRGRQVDAMDATDQWLHGQSQRIVEELASTFHEKQAYGNAPPYPRMIRSFDDQWARTADQARYISPIANLISGYVSAILAEADNDGKVVEFKPRERGNHIGGEEALIERYNQIVKMIKAIASGNSKSDLEELPSIRDIGRNPDFQKALINHEFPADVAELIRSDGAAGQFSALIHLVLVSSYVLNRVALTVVRGKNEHYAFTVFESLNTTGEPLTAFETFKPRVVSAETLGGYETSAARQSIDEVSRYLSTFKVGDPLQAATRDLLIYFAAAETGAKLSKRLADQRRYLKDEYERYEASPPERKSFVANLRDVSQFVEKSWTDSSPNLHGLPADATSDSVKLCLSFLKRLNHSVTIAPLSRFYSAALESDDQTRPQAVADFESALKAMTAFSVLWRASRRTTGNIDSEYREIMLGLGEVIDDKKERAPNVSPLARSVKRGAVGVPAPEVNVNSLKSHLRARLSSPFHGQIPDRDHFIEEASKLPIYNTNRVVARIILLAAYHDAVEDVAVPGLIVKGKVAVSSCLSYSGFTDERHLSLEHIAPQQTTFGWSADVWDEKETPHTIGNLVLMPLIENASLSNRPWVEKKALYSALSSRSEPEARQTLADSEVDFGESTQAIVAKAAYMPHLAAVASAQGDWNADLIKRRSNCLFGLAWDELYEWLM